MHFIAPPNAHALAILQLPLGFEIFPFQSHGETVQAVDCFSGFGREARVAVCALMIAGQGLVQLWVWRRNSLYY